MTRFDFLIGAGVLALLVSLAGVPGSTSDDRLLEIADARIRSAVDLATSLARSTQSPHGVAFDVESDRIAIINVRGEIAADPVSDRETLVDLGQAKLATDVDLLSARFGRAGTICIIDGNGLPMSGGQVRLAAGLHRRTLLIDAASGWVDTTSEILDADG